MNLEPLQRAIQSTALSPLTPFLQESFLDQIRHGDFVRWRQRLAALPQFPGARIDIGDTIEVRGAGDLEPQVKEALRTQLMEFVPWRKGPFRLFGIDIDAEWRSQMKWARVSPHISDLNGRTVLDVGSGNGYYGYRMLGEGASLVIGLDQHIPYVAQFWATRQFAGSLPVYVLPLSLQALPDDLEAFDSVFSMGVIYHAKSPIEHLIKLRSALKRGGELVLETLFVPGDEGYSLTPAASYARMARLWFIPSLATLERWLSRCGFSNIRVVNTSTTTGEEQRQTEWMPYDSLSAGLDPEDPRKTVEGYPSPQRVIMIANRL